MYVYTYAYAPKTLDDLARHFPGYMCVNIYTNINMYVHIHIYIYMYTYMSAYKCMNTDKLMHACRGGCVYCADSHVVGPTVWHVTRIHKYVSM